MAATDRASQFSTPGCSTTKERAPILKADEHSGKLKVCHGYAHRTFDAFHSCGVGQRVLFRSDVIPVNDPDAYNPHNPLADSPTLAQVVP